MILEELFGSRRTLWSWRTAVVLEVVLEECCDSVGTLLSWKDVSGSGDSASLMGISVCHLVFFTQTLKLE